MRGKLLFLGGVAAGFVIGTRAGRETYDQLVLAARRLRDNPTVQETTGVVQEQASRLMSDGRERVADRLSNSRFAETPLGQKVLDAMDTEVAAMRRQEAETAH